MAIQWFPGHMTKSLRLMEENIKLIDFIIYLLDARAPFSCLNPSFEKIVFKKPILYILNKSDMSDPIKTKQWLDFFRKQGKKVVQINSTSQTARQKVLTEIFDLTQQLNQKYKSKGIYKVLRGMVIGVPNTGKSTLINTLCGSKRAVTGDKPGVTKGKQWIKLDNGIELMDTPGTLWPSFSDQETAKKLVFIGSIKDEIIDTIEIAKELIVTLIATYPQLFKERYALETLDESAINIFDMICVKRGFILKGQEFDYERCANALIDDFRKGRIGNITLDELSK